MTKAVREMGWRLEAGEVEEIGEDFIISLAQIVDIKS